MGIHSSNKIFGRNSEFFKQQSEFFPQKKEISHFISDDTEASGPPSNIRKKNWGRMLAVITSSLILSSADKVLRHEKQQTSDFYYIDRITYTVQSGDTLWDIARKYMGGEWGYFIIARENALNNPHLIFPGDVLTIPIIREKNK